MKKIVVVLLCCSLFQLVNAQERPLNAVKLNPLSLLFITGNVTYERAVSENQSVQLGVFYSGVRLSDLKYSGLGITPEYRFYFGGHKEALNGVYAGPFLRYQHFKLKDKSSGDEAKYSSFGGGGVIGWEKAYESGLVLDLFVGPAYYSGKLGDNSNQNEFDVNASFDGFTIRTGITLGFSF